MFRLEVSDRDLSAAADEIIRDILRELRTAVEEETRGLEKDLEGITRMAVPGKLWRAWKSETFPAGGGLARKPGGEVYVNGGDRSQGAMVFNSQSGRIRNKGLNATEWLAIPTKAAGSRGRRRDLTPGKWEAATGRRLTYVPAKGGSRYGVLVDYGVTNERTGAYRPATARRMKADQRRGKVREAKMVVIFVLIPLVDFKPAFSIETLHRRREASLAARVERMARSL